MKKALIVLLMVCGIAGAGKSKRHFPADPTPAAGCVVMNCYDGPDGTYCEEVIISSPGCFPEVL